MMTTLSSSTLQRPGATFSTPQLNRHLAPSPLPPTPASEPPQKRRRKIKQESPGSTPRPTKLERFTPAQEAWLLATVAELYPSPTDKRDWGLIAAKYNAAFAPPRTYHGLSIKYTHLSGRLLDRQQQAFVWLEKHGKWLLEHIEKTYLDAEGCGADKIRWEDVNKEFEKTWKKDYGEAGLLGRFVRLWQPGVAEDEWDEEIYEVVLPRNEEVPPRSEGMMLDGDAGGKAGQGMMSDGDAGAKAKAGQGMILDGDAGAKAGQGMMLDGDAAGKAGQGGTEQGA